MLQPYEYGGRENYIGAPPSLFDKAFVCNTRDILLQTLEAFAEEGAEERRVPWEFTSCFMGVQAFGERFPEHVPELVGRLSSVFPGLAGKLDFEAKSLYLLEEEVIRYNPRWCCDPKIWIPILAYAGEMVRRSIGGEWQMKRRATQTYLAPEIWEPVLLKSDGSEYRDRYGAIFEQWYEMLREKHPPEYPFAALIVEMSGRGRR